MNKIEFSKLEKKEDMIMAFNQLKDDYSLLFSDNQDLKKQLEESIKSYTEENALRHKIDLELDTVMTRQKEFIEWLEHYKKALLNVGSKITIDCVLEKYKQMVGGNNDQ